MIIGLVIIICVLLGITTYQHFKIKKSGEDLIYIKNKLTKIVDEADTSKIMLFTDDSRMIALLEEINRLLEFNRMINVNHVKTENSMRKMLSNISHDLKTPLTVVLGYIETIRLDGDMNAEERERLLEKVESKAKELLVLINKFFDLAKLESEDKQLELERLELNEVCRENILAFYDILTAKDFEVNIDIPEKPLYAIANREALDRILNNLMSNAIKYGDAGKTVGLKLYEEGENVCFEVWDKGMGIKEADQDKVFERMYTLEDSRNKYNEGSGLGLTITKRLVEKLGGSIVLESRPYEKTSFKVKLKKDKF